MSKKLLDVLPTLQTFQDNVISQLTNMFNGAEWLNDTTSYTKQETIYKLLMLKYGDRQIRYDDENIFLNKLIFDLADFLPDIYAKQQVFIKNKLNEFLSDNRNRAVIIDNTSTNSRNTDNNTKFANSSTPLNLVISNANEITNAPISSLNLSNVKFLENYNGNNQQVNYNFVNDLIKTLNSDYSLRLNEFMELLGKHFISVVGSYYTSVNDAQTVKDEPYRFNNGFLVNEVDYLCTDNKQEINRFNEKLGRLNDQVATKQNQLTAGSNISINNNVISANVPQVDLSNYYNKQQIDIKQQEQDRNIVNNTMVIARVNQEVANNTTNITTNTNDINRLDNEVVKLTGNQTISGTKTFNNQIVANEGLTTGTMKAITSGDLELGYGAGVAYITPEDNSGKILKFGGKSGKGRFNLDLENQSRLMGVADPTANFHAANKQYVDNLNNQNVKLTQDQSIAGNKTFTDNVSFNSTVSINSAGNDFTWETTRNWNQNIDNTLTRTKDFKYVKKWEHTSEIRANNTWNMNTYAWTMDGINTNGIHEFFISLETRDGSLFSFNFKIMWKQGLSKSLSNKITLHKPDNDSVIDFVFAIHNDNKLHMYIKNISGSIAINWVRCWVVRDSNLPWKVNQQW